MNGSVLRLLDANANRAREALRVLEDYARFVLDDAASSGELKHLRHELMATLGARLPEAILHRDTPGDVGTANKTESEQTRTDLEHVVTAAGKRLGEALRSIEEFLKTDSPADAAKLESLRYRFYDIEKKLALTLRGTKHFANVRLYVLITEKLCSRPWLETAEQAILGGADCLQLREKDLDGAELLCRAKSFVQLCRRHNVLAIINDRPDIALLSGADGVHVGQEDLPATEIRKLLGTGKIVGVSTHRIEQARQAVLDGADYIGVGPFFRSSTKPRDFVAGAEYARHVTRTIRIPAVAIAGITEENVDEVLDTGIEAVAVSSAVIGSSDPQAAVRRIKSRLVGQTFLSSPDQQREESQPQSEIGRRDLPRWPVTGSTYFVTFRVDDTLLEQPDRAAVLHHVKAGDGTFYRLLAATVMPDHTQLLLQPNEGIEVSRIVKGMKGTTARLLNAIWKAKRNVWQEQTSVSLLNDSMEFDEKLHSMLNEPVKAGLVSDSWMFDGWYCRRSAD